MALTLRYSLQKSTLKPSGIKGEYARLQVDTRPEQEKITISNTDYQKIVQALTEGRLIGLQNEDGLHIGQFMTSLSGGVIVKDFASASKEDMKVSFKPTQHLLSDIRKFVSFEQVATVKHDPSIAGFTFVDNAGKVFTNQVLMSTNGVLKITGTKFVKNGMQVSITQANSTAKVQLETQVNSGAKYINVLINNTDIDKSSGFTAGEGLLIVRRQDNPKRKYEYEFEII